MSTLSALILGKFKIGDVISFEVHAGSILSQDYDNVKAVGIVPASLCQNFGEDVYAIHEQLIKLIPTGRLPAKADQYQYLIVENQNGNKRLVGLPWINETTIRVFSRNRVTFEVEDVAQEDINLIADAIAHFGYHVATKVTPL